MTQRKSVALQAVTQVTQVLRVARLDSIKSRILALALLGTLVPAAITVSVAYVQNRRALEAKITQDLLSESSQTAAAISIWFKDRLYDLKVFAGSEEVSGNLARASQGVASPRLREYLRSVHERIPDFEELMVLDATGRVVATSAAQPRPVQLPAGWQRTLRRDGQVIGDAYWDDSTSKGKLVVAVPVNRIDGRVMGAFAVEMSLAPIRESLHQFLGDSVNRRIFLVSDSGAVVATSSGAMKELLATSLRPSIARRVREAESSGLSYWNFEGREVLGAVKSVPQVSRWSVISEMPMDLALQQVRDFRNYALMVVVALLVVVGATAWRLGIVIVRPLERLAEGAAEVARGDLDVDLPANDAKAGEVTALTQVFNDMVARLRQGREQLAAVNERLRVKNDALEKLSVTDGLTGLTNHRALMQRLTEEAMRSRRTKSRFSLIMCDVDHFKQYNDTFGHPEGDVVLKQVAGILKEATRTVDCVARYGGEEFAALLPETDLAGALEVAERIRSRVEAAEFPGRKVTLSLGVAEFPKHDDTAQGVLAAADAALYIAKHAGRNQVARPARADHRKLPAAKAPRKSTAVKSSTVKKRG